MADTETTGSKRKLKENAFTAKAESGTLKVKILRREQQGNVPSSASTVATKTRSRRATKAPPASDSPPKPRPNRKHVPIFYEPQFRRPIKRGGRHSTNHSSSTDEHSTSSTNVPGIHSASTETSGVASSSSTSSSFVSHLSDVKFDEPPRANPLFARNDSDGLSTLGELLRPYLPSGSQPSFPQSSSAGLLMDRTAGLSSALHQLASSSASYRSALEGLSTANDKGIETTPATSTTSHATQHGALGSYKFDPLAALQTAIDHAQRASTKDNKSETPREVGSPSSNTRFYRLEPSGSTQSNEVRSKTLGSPPELPPAITLQNLLIGGGIHRFSLPKRADSVKHATSSSSNDESEAKDALAALGPPPDDPPSFLLSNSLSNGSISILNLPRTNPSLDRLGSLTRLISQANETTKDLNTTLSSPPKTNPGLDRLMSLSSVISEDGEATKITKQTAAPDTSSTSSSTTHETEDSNSEAMELGPPPTGPPAFTIGNSLMGGGIELQPAATNVNTHNFDWKLHRSASSSGGNTATKGASRGLRAQLEQTLAGSQNGTNQS
ncbi:uncharacterized protein PITG_17772 [Phytophthora infestans T30-4]|uniref:Uncharacterized protein n=1 Tax=Phytophthora infestans (strain T30-4) TaxID=403677 RepID=D0NW87_PHYIT|nr:uncharacterized protein PITG_17772 [Phytophthora infestans T30-4]EEY66904.1 conserved hypothetical protein [Phytophthora infestans T30-4]|eukprot:XP_002896622.1 conserved hypothetical protein [Phytophthora infestans T30-4]